MNDKHSVRLMRTEIRNFKNVNYGNVPYVNYASINRRGAIEKTDIVGVYGQNGSGKTALVEALDIVKWIISGIAIDYDTYAGLLPREKPAEITTEFFIENVKTKNKYKATYTCSLRANDELKRIEIFKEKLTYWSRGSAWKSMRELTFENPFYDNADILNAKSVGVKSEHAGILTAIPYLKAMQNLALVCAQKGIAVFFNAHILKSFDELEENDETLPFIDVINGIMQFGAVDLNVIKVNQLGTINNNRFIPINVRRESESRIVQQYINLFIGDVSEIPLDLYKQVQAAIDAINTAIQAIVPNLRIELEMKAELEKPDGSKAVQVEVYSNRDGKRFLIRYESEGIKRIISILNYLISVFNNPGVCLVVDELDSGIFEYLLGEMLGLMGREMKGQLIFTSHNLRILEMLDSKDIVCSTTNPNNRYIRLTGIEKNHNKRDFYIRAITVGGQKEELYDEDDLTAMGYAFRKAGQTNRDQVKLSFSPEFEKMLQNVT